MNLFVAVAAAVHLFAADHTPRCTPEGCFQLASIPLTGAGKAAGGGGGGGSTTSQFAFPDGSDLILVAAAAS